MIDVSPVLAKAKGRLHIGAFNPLGKTLGKRPFIGGQKAPQQILVTGKRADDGNRKRIVSVLTEINRFR